MAKNTANQVILLAVAGGAGLITFEAAKEGKLGPDAKKAAEDLAKFFKGVGTGTTPTPSGTPTSNPSPSTPGIQRPPTDSGSDPYTAHNPNFQTQMNQWKLERAARGQDQNDWGAFRAYEVAIGAPDPGQYAPSDGRFMSYY